MGIGDHSAQKLISTLFKKTADEDPDGFCLADAGVPMIKFDEIRVEWTPVISAKIVFCWRGNPIFEQDIPFGHNLALTHIKGKATIFVE